MSNGKPSNELQRIIAAFGHASAGIRVASAHPAFRTELLAALVMIPLACILGKTGSQHALLLGSVMLVLIVELLNTGIETAIDRISADWHPLSKLAKDVGSAAVLLSLINAGAVWCLVLWF